MGPCHNIGHLHGLCNFKDFLKNNILEGNLNSTFLSIILVPLTLVKDFIYLFNIFLVCFFVLIFQLHMTFNIQSQHSFFFILILSQGYFFIDF